MISWCTYYFMVHLFYGAIPSSQRTERVCSNTQIYTYTPWERNNYTLRYSVPWTQNYATMLHSTAHFTVQIKILKYLSISRFISGLPQKLNTTAAATTLSADISNLHRGVIYQLQIAERLKQSDKPHTLFSFPTEVRTGKYKMSQLLFEM